MIRGNANHSYSCSLRIQGQTCRLQSMGREMTHLSNYYHSPGVQHSDSVFLCYTPLKVIIKQLILFYVVIICSLFFILYSQQFVSLNLLLSLYSPLPSLSSLANTTLSSISVNLFLFMICICLF